MKLHFFMFPFYFRRGTTDFLVLTIKAWSYFEKSGRLNKKCNLTFEASPPAFVRDRFKIYCRMPAGRGLRRTTLAPGHDETRTSDPLAILLSGYEFLSSVIDRQKVVHMSPPCNMHRWAQQVGARKYVKTAIFAPFCHPCTLILTVQVWQVVR